MAEPAAPTVAGPQVLSVQHFCLHDGPGIRSTVFLKGCPLHCIWCQNPESWSRRSELGFKQRLCNDCGRCMESCQPGAMTAPGVWSADVCTRCFECVDACPSGALTRYGEPRSAEDVAAELASEFTLYRSSGGGVTFSGGEASLFPEYVAALLEPLIAAGVHTAIETCGLFRLKHLQPVEQLLESEEAWRLFAEQTLWQAIGALDLVLFDLKIVDSAAHRRNCGAPNQLILDNFRLLTALAAAGRGPEVWPRMPLVPGITDDEANIRAVARVVRESGQQAITLLSYHNLGAEKLDWLRKPAGFRGTTLPRERLEWAGSIVLEEGLRWFEPGESQPGGH